MADPALADFLNRLRILQSIDFHELKAAGLFNHEHEIQEWETFRTHPWSWMMHAPDADAAAVWAILQRRSRTFPVIANFLPGQQVLTDTDTLAGARVAVIKQSRVMHLVEFVSHHDPARTYPDHALKAVPK